MKGEDGFVSSIDDWPCNMPYARGDGRRDECPEPEQKAVESCAWLSPEDERRERCQKYAPIIKPTKQQEAGFLTDKQKRRRFRR